MTMDGTGQDEDTNNNARYVRYGSHRDKIKGGRHKFDAFKTTHRFFVGLRG